MKQTDKQQTDKIIKKKLLLILIANISSDALATLLTSINLPNLCCSPYPRHQDNDDAEVYTEDNPSSLTDLC